MLNVVWLDFSIHMLQHLFWFVGFVMKEKEEDLVNI